MKFNYDALDRDTEKLFPIDPLREKKLTHFEIRKRESRFYNYKKLWFTKLRKQKLEALKSENKKVSK